jgi:hypothetical protein
MRNRVMKYLQGSYNHETKIRGLQINMGNVETKSNERRDMHEPLIMRNLQRQVQIYRVNNERILKAQ